MTEKSYSQPAQQESLITKITFDHLFTKKTLTQAMLAIPILITPLLYLIGRLHSISYLRTLGIPLGSSNIDFLETIMSGFVFGIFLPSYDLLWAMAYMVLFITVLYLIIFIAYLLPSLAGYLYNKFVDFSKFLKVQGIFSRTEEEHKAGMKILTKNSDLILVGLIACFLFFLLLLCILVVEKMSKRAINQGETAAQEVITKANQADCEKAPQTDCHNYLELVLKTADKPTTLKGFNLLSGPKEWAIYQPPSLSGKPTGILHLIKREHIQSAHHPVSFAVTASSGKNED